MQKLKGYRFPWPIIYHCIYLYHRFSHSYRDIEETMYLRGIQLSYESIRRWCKQFSYKLADILKKKQPQRSDKWHLDEMIIRINGEKYVLWRAVDSKGYELDMLIQKRKNKKAAIRFLKRLLDSHPEPRVIVTEFEPLLSIVILSGRLFEPIILLKNLTADFLSLFLQSKKSNVAPNLSTARYR